MEEFFTDVISVVILRYGYLAVFVLMVAESALIPIPSEITMLYGGALANDAFVRDVGTEGVALNLVLVGFIGAVANLVGSWLAYILGRIGGRPLVERWGRYVLIRPHHIDRAEVWFERHGEAAVFFGRLLPVVRTFISLPAGVAQMNVVKFTIYTFLGCLPWTFALAYAGYLLGGRWDSIVPYFTPISIAIGLVCLAVAGWWLWRTYNERRAAPVEEPPA